MGLHWTPLGDAWSESHLGGYSNLSTVDSSQGPGTRSYAMTGYLTPNSGRQNLEILTEATMAKVALDQSTDIPTTKSVTFLFQEKQYEVSARKEVILAAGVVQTPQILELSGIGSREVIHWNSSHRRER